MFAPLIKWEVALGAIADAAARNNVAVRVSEPRVDAIDACVDVRRAARRLSSLARRLATVGAWLLRQRSKRFHREVKRNLSLLGFQYISGKKNVEGRLTLRKLVVVSRLRRALAPWCILRSPVTRANRSFLATITTRQPGHRAGLCRCVELDDRPRSFPHTSQIMCSHRNVSHAASLSGATSRGRSSSSITGAQ